MFLALDLGTTHFRAALFNQAGLLSACASRPTPTRRAPAGNVTYDPQEVWDTVLALLAELHAMRRDEVRGREPVRAVGIASMAETGLLVDQASGEPRTSFLPWFDRLAALQAKELEQRADYAEAFCRHGVRPTFKSSLAKLLWLNRQDSAQLRGATWLSLADYVAYRLTGRPGTHANLAVRTAAFCLDTGQWDAALLDELKLPVQIFPPVLPAFQPVGGVKDGSDVPGLAVSVPVVIAGHDHLCGAFAAFTMAGGLERLTGGEVAPAFQLEEEKPVSAQPGSEIPPACPVYQSLGTAEALVGAFPARPLCQADYHSGFSFSLHAEPGWMGWVGGISASGGSIEWLRGVLGDPSLSYADLDALLEGAARPPTGIIYLPYLSGSGSPHSDGRARAAFFGLSAAHSRADLYQAVLEGVAYEAAYIRQAAQNVVGQPIRHILAAGGGTRNRAWMQIRADVLGCPLDVLDQPEMTLLGAALLAGLGSGVYASPAEASTVLSVIPVRHYIPDAARHEAYQPVYEDFLAKQKLSSQA